MIKIFFIYKNKQYAVYIQILKKINISFKYSYSDSFRHQKISNSLRFQTKKTNTTLVPYNYMIDKDKFEDETTQMIKIYVTKN